MSVVEKIIILNIFSAISFIVGIWALGGNVHLFWKISLTALGLALLGAASFLEYRQYRVVNEVFKAKKNSTVNSQVTHYLREMIQTSGSVAIFTRNMTWADSETLKVLDEKADSGDLTIVMLGRTDESSRLEQRGAKIWYYGEVLDQTLKSRFTIINSGSNSATLAIGHRENDIHRIHKFQNAKDPAFSLAQDMLAFAEASISHKNYGDASNAN